VHPKKSLGQHWLHDEASLNAMIDAGDLSSTDTVLEVGPGLGTLTKKLCQKVKKVIAVELDDKLAANLKNHIIQGRTLNQGPSWMDGAEGVEVLEVVHQSILDFDLSIMPNNYKVIANIPYYLTSNLIRKLLEYPNRPSRIVLLIQKEVAERIVADPGNHSILSVSVQFYAQAELGPEVPDKLFTPPPKVDSQIIQITPRFQPLFPDVAEKEFFKIVKAGFSEKRKKLRSSLSGSLGISKDTVDEWLKRSNISANARAQELDLNDWYQLYKHAIL
jgi:16S rRNA (adenine1518-N6/adenine1519-N6)-dimethyltransferase